MPGHRENFFFEALKKILKKMWPLSSRGPHKKRTFFAVSLTQCNGRPVHRVSKEEGLHGFPQVSGLEINSFGLA